MKLHRIQNTLAIIKTPKYEHWHYIVGYPADLTNVTTALEVHQYADDVQLYRVCYPSVTLGCVMGLDTLVRVYVPCGSVHAVKVRILIAAYIRDLNFGLARFVHEDLNVKRAAMVKDLM